MHAHRYALTGLLFASACSGAPKTHGSSTAEHDRAAREHEVAAREIESQCAQDRRGELTAPIDREPAAIERLDRPGEPCWKAGDKRFLDAHRAAATNHRTASAELRAAEANKCEQISDEDRAVSPFERTADITAIETFPQNVETTNASGDRRPVAIVTFRAVRGLTADWLQQAIDCHIARDAALGHLVPEMPDCPLVPRGVVARVTSSGTSFSVELAASDPKTAREVVARAQRLLAHKTAAGE